MDGYCASSFRLFQSPAISSSVGTPAGSETVGAEKTRIGPAGGANNRPAKKRFCNFIVTDWLTLLPIFIWRMPGRFSTGMLELWNYLSKIDFVAPALTTLMSQVPVGVFVL